MLVGFIKAVATFCIGIVAFRSCLVRNSNKNKGWCLKEKNKNKLVEKA
jgi:hypothetical protein